MHPNSYYGGKYRYAKKIAKVVKMFKTDERVYIEPFAGFCFVAKELAKQKTFERFFVSDINESLIMLLRESSRGHFIPPDDVDKETYVLLRRQEFPSALQAFVGFCYSFNNIYFRGYRTAYTPDDGAEKKKRKVDLFVESMKLLKDVDISLKDYKDYEAHEGCFFYLDPPYAARTEHYKTHDKEIIRFDTDEFWEFARRLSKKNTVLVSEYSAPDDFECVYEFKGLHATERIFKLKTTYL